MIRSHSNIAGSNPAVIFDCPECGGDFVVRVVEVRTSKPLQCPSCVGKRFVTYREFLYLQERFSLALLEYSIGKLRTPGAN